VNITPKSKDTENHRTTAVQGVRRKKSPTRCKGLKVKQKKDGESIEGCVSGPGNGAKLGQRRSMVLSSRKKKGIISRTKVVSAGRGSRKGVNGGGVAEEVGAEMVGQNDILFGDAPVVQRGPGRKL